MNNSMYVVWFDLFNPLTDWDPVQQRELFYVNVIPRRSCSLQQIL